MGKTGNRGKTLRRFWLGSICFALIAALALSYAAYVLTPKHVYGVCGMMNLYRQPRETVDVLVLGTSLAYAGVNTNILWSEYGIASYNLCSAEQPFWISYYYLEEALKTQKPSLILLDAKPAIYVEDYIRSGRAILSTGGILSPWTRLKAVRACVGDQEALDYALVFPKLHRNYANLTAADFVFPPDNGGRGSSWKGYIEENGHERHERPSLVWVKTKREMNRREEEYARKILELARLHDIPVLLVGFPNPDYAGDHLFYNALWEKAAEYGVDGINYNDPDLRFGLRYSTDFADWQHLNVKGSVTFSRRLGADLMERFSLTDRRGDPAYASYDECAGKWFASYPEYAGKESQR